MPKSGGVFAALFEGSRLRGYGIAAGATAVVYGIGSLLHTQIELAILPLFMAGIMLSAWFGGLGPGLASTVASGLLCTYYFIPPIHSLYIPDAMTAAQVVEFIAGGIVISVMTSKLHALLTRSRIEAKRQAFLAKAGALLVGCRDYDGILSGLTAAAVPEIADWCAMSATDDQGTTRSAWAGRDPDLARELGRCAPEFPASDGPSAAGTPEQLHLLRRLDLRTGLRVPIRIEDRTIGSLGFGLSKGRRAYSEEDLSLLRDVALRAALAIENVRLYALSQRAVQSRDQFISVASHEMKTPLGALLLQLEFAIRCARKGDVGEAAAAVERSAKQGARLTTLVDNLLDLSRVTAGRLVLNLKETDLTAVVRAAAESLKDEMNRSGSRITVEASGPVAGHWDPVRMEQVVTNLLSNAVKYGDGKPIELRLSSNESRATLVVQDHGVGMEPEFLKRIFTPYERAQTSQGRRGFGLGLSVTREIVLAHGGSIDVRSERGAGSTFTVELPRQRLL